MDLRQIGLFKLMTDKMDWHSQRNQVLSDNIANADTPHYQAKDLTAFDFKRQLRQTSQLQPVASNPGHLTGTLPNRGSFRDERDRPYETSPDGNGVVLEEQMFKVGQNSMEYQTVLNLYRKQVGMLRTAMTPSRG